MYENMIHSAQQSENGKPLPEDESGEMNEMQTTIEIEVTIQDATLVATWDKKWEEEEEIQAIFDSSHVLFHTLRSRLLRSCPRSTANESAWFAVWQKAYVRQDKENRSFLQAIGEKVPLVADAMRYWELDSEAYRLVGIQDVHHDIVGANYRVLRPGFTEERWKALLEEMKSIKAKYGFTSKYRSPIEHHEEVYSLEPWEGSEAYKKYYGKV